MNTLYAFGKFKKFLQNLANILQIYIMLSFSWKLWSSSSALQNCGEFPTKLQTQHLSTLKFKMETIAEHMIFVENSFLRLQEKKTNCCWNFEVWEVQKHVHRVDLVESFQTSIYYLLETIGVDTAENEPLKAWRWFNSSFHSLPCYWIKYCQLLSNFQ